LAKLYNLTFCFSLSIPITFTFTISPTDTTSEGFLINLSFVTKDDGIRTGIEYSLFSTFCSISSFTSNHSLTLISIFPVK